MKIRRMIGEMKNRRGVKSGVNKGVVIGRLPDVVNILETIN